MGPLGLEGRGGRPLGKGSLLLAVAGATSLVTLLLVVPVTVLAVLALVPQDQGGLVPKTADPGAQAQQGPEQGPGKRRPSPPAAPPLAPQGLPTPSVSQMPSSFRKPGAPSLGIDTLSSRGMRGCSLPSIANSLPLAGFRELPEEEPETDLSPRLPAAHLIGAWTKGQGLGWEATQEEAFLSSGTRFSDAEGLALPQDGLYYLYCHVGYRGRAPPAGGARALTLRSSLYRAGGAYGPGAAELLLEGAETVSPVPGPAGRPGYGPLWYASVGFGGLVQLRRGERVYVNISRPDMVDYGRGKTFFGAVMVG
ncbi:lymphotoxin-beta isoform X2 [Microcebus murinus]|uniref:lymphotoxin-beta isoform X2 n=1 Tax=Microcebus murinus TaxID=30608 RepID=UPI003F6C4D09